MKSRHTHPKKAKGEYRQKPSTPSGLSEGGSLLKDLRIESGTLTSKGQTTIPKSIRDQLGLKAGDVLTYMVDGGRIIIRPKNRSIKDLGNILPKPKRVATLEDMEESIARGAVEGAGFRY